MKGIEVGNQSKENIQNPADLVMTAEEYAESRHDTPYVYEVSEGDVDILYFGANHSSTPEDPMFDEIEERFKSFNADIVLVEGMGSLEERKEQKAQRLRDHSKEDAIDMSGESGFVLKLAADEKIDFISPEPKPKDEIDALESQGFSRDEIFAYYFYRLIPQWHRQPNKPDIKDYVEPHLRGLAEDSGWDDYDFSFDHAVKIGEELWGEDINLENEGYYHDKTDPIPWEEAKDLQGVINRVSRACSRFRDQHMIQRLSEVLETYKRPFIVFGASHAFMQEPAIRKLVSTKSS
ncbi:hypothetical protein KC727_00955 [Candidatus Kaiserbacteria bacterium]|nr:hypothetical protein [Candidatus Kaiserbacteria bacterium]